MQSATVSVTTPAHESSDGVSSDRQAGTASPIAVELRIRRVLACGIVYGLVLFAIALFVASVGRAVILLVAVVAAYNALAGRGMLPDIQGPWRAPAKAAAATCDSSPRRSRLER